jgi:hypothetical protein
MIALSVAAGVVALHQNFVDRFGFSSASLVAMGLTFWTWTACWQAMAWTRGRVIGAAGACFVVSLVGMGLVWVEARSWGFALVSMALAGAAVLLLRESSWSWVPRAWLSRVASYGGVVAVLGITYAMGVAMDPKPMVPERTADFTFFHA